MITTITLNAAIDKTYYIPNFYLNSVNRVQEMYSVPGGKGINVAKVMKLLGVPIVASGFIGGKTGNTICRSLESLGIDHDFVKVEEESRICLNIIDEQNGSQTEILEQGPVISEAEWESMKQKVAELSHKSRYVIFSGSLTKGLSKNSYFQLVHIAQENGAKAIVDSSGSELKEAIMAKPYMIKPNEEELRALVGKQYLSENDIFEAINTINKKGIEIVIVSLGEDGALAGYNGHYYKIIPPSIEPVNEVGCGDSLVAGITAGLSMKQSFEDALLLGVASAAANALEREAGHINLKAMKQLRNKAKIQKYVM